MYQVVRFDYVCIKPVYGGGQVAKERGYFSQRSVHFFHIHSVRATLLRRVDTPKI